ncbi:Phage integrase family protein [Marinovum algicola]|uniref:Phage integrase family protein n=1 Tax=Marinovum algicola TaxID=42444 RepID=A0A975WE38_9RHOB|nr:tyrosine-type recombinase/integrase [Marinovum algicola]SEK05289.1 Phage integrase family protein [Marinovum algicola]SLN75323.1 Phage integrase family protein [Marinovum algicola]
MRKQDEGQPCWYPFWKDGSWCYDFRVEGDRYRRSTGVRDPEAITIAEEIAKGVYYAAWERAMAAFPSFEEAAELYLAEFGKNRSFVRRLIAYFGPLTRVNEIDAFTIKQCKVELRKPGWSDATARRQVTVPLKAVIHNACGLRPERVTDNKRTRIVTPEEFECLIAVAQDPPENVRDPERRLLKMLAFLIGSGATPGEMFCVRAEDIHRTSREIWIRGEEPGGGKTPYRARMVQLPVRAWELIGELPQEGRVFLSTTGREIVPDGVRGTTVIRQFHKLCAAAGLSKAGEKERLVLYSLRHAWATWFSALVGDHDLLIDRGGWAGAAMARRYRKRPPTDLGERVLKHGWDFRP